MASVCARVFPVVSKRVLLQPTIQHQVRNFFDPWARSELRAIMRDMDRLQRDFLRFPVPRMLPLDITTSPFDGNHGSYRVDVDLAGFKPEEVNVSLDEAGRVLTINARCDRKGSDGSRFVQEITKKISIPEAANISELKSFLHRDGVLAIEAPFKDVPKESSDPHQIPVNRSNQVDSSSEKASEQISS